jgi:hypothetical protein
MISKEEAEKYNFQIEKVFERHQRLKRHHASSVDNEQIECLLPLIHSYSY